MQIAVEINRRRVRKQRVEGEAFRIGRSDDNHCVLNHGGVSRSHARILKKANRFWVEDLGSRHGTYINGQKIQHSTLLKTGDVIQIPPYALRVNGGRKGGKAVKLALLALLALGAAYFVAPNYPMLRDKVRHYARLWKLRAAKQAGDTGLFDVDSHVSERKSKLIASYLEEGTAQVKNLQFREAADTMRKILSLDPGNRKAQELFLAARNEMQQKAERERKLAEARERREREQRARLKQLAREKELRERRRLQAAAEKTRTQPAVVQVDPAEKVPGMIERGKRTLLKGDITQAAQLLREAVALDPSDRSGRIREAKALLNQLQQAQEKKIRPLLDRIEAFSAKGAWMEAAIVLKSAEKQAPNNRQVLALKEEIDFQREKMATQFYHQGLAMEAQQKFSQAVSKWRKALMWAPGPDSAVYQQAEMKIKRQM